MEVIPGYKQTEVGVIPEDWDQTTIRSITTKVGSGITPRGGSSNYKEYGRPFVRSQNVGWGNLLLDDLVYIDDETHYSFSATELREGDVLLNITGASIGRSALADARLSGGNVNQHVCIIRSDPSEVVPSFVKYFLLSDLGQRQIDNFQAGGNREGLNFGQIKSIRIPLPPTKVEQEAIAEVLSKADALIEYIERLIAKKRLLKKGVMQKLLRPKDGWLTKSLGSLATLINGRAYSITEWEITGTPVIRLQNLTGRGEIYYYSTLDLPEKQYCHSGDLLYMWSATFGPIIWRGPKAIFHYHIWKIECQPRQLNKEYLYHLLSDITERLKSNSSNGGTMLHLTKSGMEAMEISIPSYEEQETIATILSAMDAEIALLEAQLAKYRQLKQGLMQKLLTGRIRLV